MDDIVTGATSDVQGCTGVLRGYVVAASTSIDGNGITIAGVDSVIAAGGGDGNRIGVVGSNSVIAAAGIDYGTGSSR